MNIYSVINKQELTPKQKAILLHWQYSKGTFKNKKAVTIQDYLECYEPLYTDAEFDKLMNYEKRGDRHELYLWTEIISFTKHLDTVAQRYYHEMVAHLQTVTIGLPYISKYCLENEDSNKYQFFSFTSNKRVSFIDEVVNLIASVYFYFLHTYTVALLNLLMDEKLLPLLSVNYLCVVFTFDEMIETIIETIIQTKNIQDQIIETILMKNIYENNKQRIIKESFVQFTEIIKPLERYSYFHFSEVMKEQFQDKVDKLFDNAMPKILE